MTATTDTFSIEAPADALTAPAITFSQNDIPDRSWGQDRLTAFCRVLGKRTMFDRWRLGRAINLAVANMGKPDRDEWYKDVLPGWSRSTIDRMRRLARNLR